jgi:hypothetical protein
MDILKVMLTYFMSISRRIFIVFIASALSSCGKPIPSSALPLKQTLSTALNTSAFKLTDGPDHHDGCSLLGSCGDEYWSVCFEYNDTNARDASLRTIINPNAAEEIDPDLRYFAVYSQQEGWTVIYWPSNGLLGCRE